MKKTMIKYLLFIFGVAGLLSCTSLTGLSDDVFNDGTNGNNTTNINTNTNSGDDLEVSLISPTNGEVLTSPFTVSGSAFSSAGVTKTFVIMKLTNDIIAATYEANFTNSGLVFFNKMITTNAGTYEIWAQAFDGTSKNSESVIVTVQSGGGATDTTPPSVNISSPANGAAFTEPANISITGTASDTESSVTAVYVALGATTNTVTGSAWSSEFSGVVASNYIVRAWASDSSGNVSSPVSIAISVTNATSLFPDIKIYKGTASIADGATGAHDFGTVTTNSYGTAQVFTISNTGDADLTDLDVSIVGTDASQFVVVSDVGSSTVGSNAQTTFSINFNPSTIGTKTATIVVSNNVGAKNPYTFEVTGTGQAGAVPILAVYIGGSQRTDGYAIPSFGTVNVGSSGTAVTVYITNTGAASMSGVTVAEGGSNPGDFTTATMSGVGLAAGVGTNFTVNFVPTTSGARSAAITIDYTGGSTFDLSVSGTGAVVDTDPPTWTSPPAASSITNISFTLSATINENGTIYYAVYSDGHAAPSIADIKAGTGAVTYGNDTASGGAAENFSVTGLTAETAYDVYVIAQDDESTPNVMASATKVDVTTTGSGGGGGSLLSITVDGNDSDTAWSTAPVVGMSASAGWNSLQINNLKMTNDVSNLYIWVEATAVADWSTPGLYIDIAINTNGVDSGNTANQWGRQYNFAGTSYGPQFQFVIEIGDDALNGTIGYDLSGELWNSWSASMNNAEVDVVRTSGFELKVPLTLMSIGTGDDLNVIVVLSGNTTAEHGAFDVIPEDANNTIADSWNEGSDPNQQGTYCGSYSVK